jgi:lysophospholipase L1-like esterase
MKRLGALGLLCALAAVVVLAQVSVSGGGTGSGTSSGGASFWNGTVAPSNMVGANGDFYLNTSTYCLYGPKAAGAWAATCVSLIGQSGSPGPALGYVAENTANKGAASGYAPLNSSAQVPLINLPIIPYTQISGVQLALGFTPLSPANNLDDLSNAALARSNLGLVVGTNVEPHSALLDAFAGLSTNGIVAVSGGSASSGTLSGDVTTNGLTTTVNSVGGSTAANLHNAEALANAATSSNTNSTIVMRDRSGNINATQVYAGGTAVENTANKGAPNGYAPLDGDGLLPAANLPTSVLTATTVNNGTLSGSFVNLVASGRISSSATGAGAFMMTAGAGQTPPPNTVGLQAPPSVPASFNCTWWGIPALGIIHATATTPCILNPSLVVASDLDPSMPAVDTSGSYTDLLNLPTIPVASTTTPSVNGTGAVGSSGAYARADHVHPTDTSRQAALGFTPVNTASVGVANGVAALDGNALLPVANLPNPIVTAGVGGVTANYLVARDSSNPTRYVAAGAGGCGSGVAASTATSGSTFQLYSMAGTLLSVVADNTVTAGDVLIGGSVIPGRVADSGFSVRGSVASTTCTVGIAQGSAVAGGAVTVLFDGTGSYGTQLTTATTQAPGDNSPDIATDAFVNVALGSLKTFTPLATLYQNDAPLTTVPGWQACAGAVVVAQSANACVVGYLGDSWVGYHNLAAYLGASLRTNGDAGVGVIPFYNGAGLPAATPLGIMLGHAGTWTTCNATSSCVGLNAYDMSSIDTATPATLSVYNVVCTTCVIDYYQQSGGGTFGWSIDGGTGCGGTCSGSQSTAGAATVATLALSGLTYGSHNITITITSAGTAGVRLLYLDAHIDGVSGFRVHDLGHTGATTQTFSQMSAAAVEQAALALGLNALVITLGTNDQGTNIAPSVTGTNLQAFITEIQTALPNISIWLAPPAMTLNESLSTYPISQYISVQQALIGPNLGFIESYNLFGTYTNAVNQGLMLPANVHPTFAGAWLFTSNILQNLGFPTEPAGGPLNALLDQYYARDLQGNTRFWSTTAMGPNLINNGTFANGTGWTLGSGWAISGGALVGTAATGQAYEAYVSAAGALVAGHTYCLSLTVSGYTGGNLTPDISTTLGNFGFPAITANGTVTNNCITIPKSFTGSYQQMLGFIGSIAFTGSISNVSLQEPLGANVQVEGGLEVDTSLTTLGNSATGGNSTTTGNASVGGTLGVTGNATMAGSLSVTGTLTAPNFSPPCNPLDTTCSFLREEFACSSNTTSLIGALGWAIRQVVGTTGSATCGTPSSNFDPGIIALTTPATSTDGASLALDGGAALWHNMLASPPLWDSSWVALLKTITSVQWRIGYFTSLNTSAIPTTGFYGRFDTTLSDSHYMGCVTVASTESCTTLGGGIAPDGATYARFRIREISGGTIGISLYIAGVLQGSEATFCASGCTVTVTPPTSGMVPGAIIVTATTAAAIADLDLWAFQMTGLSR